MKTAEIVKDLMKKHKIIKQTDLARIIYDKQKIETKDRVRINSYLTGISDFPNEALIKLAKFFSVPVGYLHGIDDDIQPVKQVPIVATASCGGSDVNVLQDENLKAYVPESLWNKDLYAVIACGDSMATEINDKDIVIINPLKQVLNGDMVFYKIDEESAIKIFFDDKENYLINFIPYNTNENFKIRTIRKDDEEAMSKLSFHKVVHVISSKEDNRLARLRAIGR